jgi:hypothetical protein
MTEDEKSIAWWQKEIDDNPGHPTNLYAGREIAKIKAGMIRSTRVAPAHGDDHANESIPAPSNSSKDVEAS